MADPTGTGGLYVINQRGDIQRRMYLNKQMHMVCLSAKFDECAPPVNKDIGNDFSQVLSIVAVSTGRRYFVTSTKCSLGM